MNGEQGGNRLVLNAHNASCRSADCSKMISDGLAKVLLENQLSQMKQKVHKSFMQVMQISNLHQEQLDLIRDQFQSRQKATNHLNQQLHLKITALENQLKANNKYMMDISNSSFSIDCIDIIPCTDSSINQSSILQIKQILSLTQTSNLQSKVHQFKKEILKELNLEDADQDTNIGKVLEKVFKFILELANTNLQSKEKQEELQRVLASLETQFKSIKIQCESLQKENKFLSEHIKKVLGDKNNLQRKMSDLQRSKKLLQDTLKNMKRNITQNGCKVQWKEKDNLTCYNLDISNSSNTSVFKLDDLNSSKDSQFSMKTQKFSHNQLLVGNKMLGSGDYGKVNKPSVIKNFRKNKQTLGKIQSNS